MSNMQNFLIREVLVLRSFVILECFGCRGRERNFGHQKTLQSRNSFYINSIKGLINWAKGCLNTEFQKKD